MTSPPFTILAQGVFAEGEVDLLYDPRRYSCELSAAAAGRVRVAWQDAEAAAQQGGRDLYNSPLFRLADIEEPAASPGRLALRLGDTDYREYVGTRAPGPAGERADPLGTAIIVVTADGYIPLGERSQRVEVNRGRLFTFGGFFDRAVDWEPGQARPSLFGCARRELREELRLDVPEADFRLLAVVYDRVLPHPEACLLANVPATAGALCAGRGAEEIAALHLVPLPDLGAFVERHASQVCEGLRGGLEVFLRLRRDGAALRQDGRRP